MNAHRPKRPIKDNIGRNQSCPCGSGKKFKHCCLGKPSASRPGLRAGLLWKGPLFIILLGGLIVGAVEISRDRQADTLDPGPTVPTSQPVTLPFGQTPQPWFYDTATNQHWHPAHAHWHSGPPPPPAQRQ